MRAIALLIAVVLALTCVAAHADTDYKVAIEVSGPNAGPLRRSLESTSQLVALKDRPPPSSAALRRRADDDVPRLKSAMEALGSWQVQVAYKIDIGKSPAQVTVAVTPSPLFHLAAAEFLVAGAPAALMAREGAGAVGLDIGGPALSAPVEAANDRIVSLYAANGQPFAKVTDRPVVIDVDKAR